MHEVDKTDKQKFSETNKSVWAWRDLNNNFKPINENK